MALIEELEDQGNLLFKYRSYIPILFLVITAFFFVYKIQTMEMPLISQNYWYFCLIIGFLGLAVRIYTVGHTPANTSGRNTDQGQLADELNQTGIYSLVRHPLYLGNFLMWLSVAMLTADIWFIVSFTFFYWLYYERIMFAEEAFLRKKFGDHYLNWAADKPAFVPKLMAPVTPKYPFSIKKVLKKEKNGIFALFGLFWLFDRLAYFATWGELKLELNSWFWLMVGSGVIYFILKLLKHNTKIFDEEGR